MWNELNRRRFLCSGSAAVVTLATGTVATASETVGLFSQPRSDSARTTNVPESFPIQDPAIVRSVVGASHGNYERVKELVGPRPGLANAAVDWGFGDWETAMGAASHTGARDIAMFLIEHGARPDLFTAAMLGHIEVVKAAVEAYPGIQRALGPHGFTLAHHARTGREHARDVLDYLESLGDADTGHPNLPLDDALRESYYGIYRWGTAQGETFEIKAGRRGGVWIEAGSGPGRSLFHLGNHEFLPAGSPAVRVRFLMDGGKAVQATVHDHDVVLIGTRTR